MVGEIDAGQTRRGLVGCSEGEMAGGPPLARAFGKNVSCYAVMWQAPRRIGARIRLMRPIHTNWSMLSLSETRTNSTGHLAGGREVVSPYVCLLAGTNRMRLVDI